jgi:3-oxoacyl-[acyl-carrier protein] reductase
VSPGPRRILVTGGAVGIGAATARALAPESRLLVHYNRSGDAAEALAESLAGVAAEVHLARADLTTDRGCEELHEAALTHLGALDVLVNNAGGMIERQSVGELTWQHLVDTFALNALSAMRLTSLCRSLLEGGDRACVVNVTSIAMRHGAPSATAYGAAKAAVDAFTRGAAKELAPIRVNAVAPGMIDTAFHDRVTSEALMRQFVEATPLKCIGSPEMVARTIKFVVENEFMTGETVDCNGGLFMR